VLKKVSGQCLGEICDLVYISAPLTAWDLRSCLTAAIANSVDRLVKNQCFMDKVLTLPNLLRDSFPILARQHVTAINERDAAVARALKAEGAARQAENATREAEQRGIDEKSRLIAQVNQARKCRHCSLTNNVMFETEHTVFGGIGQALRCKCRTRY
jgi:hypothetical protein